MYSGPPATTNNGIFPLSLQRASREQIATYQLNRLRTGLRRVLESNHFYQQKLSGCNPQDLTTMDALRRLPFTTKEELIADQRDHPPYGTNLTYPLSQYVRLHQTSGTTG